MSKNGSRKKETNIDYEQTIDGDKSKDENKNIDKDLYEKELKKLSIELVHLQEWIRAKGLKVVVLFEGRDAAGKGGTIKRITAPLSPRVCRVAALGIPTEKEKKIGRAHV